MPRTRTITALVVMPVLFAAWVILFLLPTRTEALWGWTIEPPMSAVTMGAGYLGGVWFFARVARAKRSLEVAGGLLAATVFTTLLGAATVIHWDKFNHSHVSFWAWLFLYFVAPPFLLVLFLANRPGTDEDDGGPEMPRWLGRLLGGLGVAQLAGALVWFADPERFAGRTPWALTPLSSRSVASFVAFTGALLAWALVDRRFLAMRAGVEAVTVGLLATGIGALIARHDFDGPPSSRVAYAVGLVVMLGVVLALQGLARRPATHACRAPATFRRLCRAGRRGVKGREQQLGRRRLPPETSGPRKTETGRDDGEGPDDPAAKGAENGGPRNRQSLVTALGVECR